MHMSNVSASGEYELRLDTLLFFYNDRNYDSMVSILGHGNVPLHQALGLPTRLLWKGKKLFIPLGDKRVKYAKFFPE